MLYRTNILNLQAGAVGHKDVQSRVTGASLFFLPKSKPQVSKAKTSRWRGVTLGGFVHVFSPPALT